MQWLSEVYWAQLWTFGLVLARIGALVMAAPIFGGRQVPVRVRGLLALSLAVLVMPLEWDRGIEQPVHLISYAILIAAEALVGLTLAVAVMILFAGVQAAGQVIGQMAGMQLAEVVDPGFDAHTPIFSQLLFYVTLAVFMTLGGHRQVIGALLDTFASIPLGRAQLAGSLVETTTTLLTQSFSLGIRAAAPAMTALLLASLILGLISRTLPQLNVLVLGFGLNVMIALATTAVSLGVVAYLFQEQIHSTIEIVLESAYVSQAQ